MNIFKPYVLIIMISLCGPVLAAEKVYTWADENGVIHITDKRPPKNGRLKDVIQYQPKTEEEIREIQQKKASSHSNRIREDILQNTKESRKIAEETKRQAAEARKRADESNQRALDFKKKVSLHRTRIKRNKYKIRKLEAEALKATEIANQAAEQARLAEKQAKETEDRAREMLEQNKNPEKTRKMKPQ
jgi:uncharacterized coiled-coil DUF342 family protein